MLQQLLTTINILQHQLTSYQREMDSLFSGELAQAIQIHAAGSLDERGFILEGIVDIMIQSLINKGL